MLSSFLSGAYTPHPNSLMFNVYPIFWPFKVFWFFRKVSSSIHLIICSLVKLFSSVTSLHPQRATLTTKSDGFISPFTTHSEATVTLRQPLLITEPSQMKQRVIDEFSE